jgi:hypothetical protein
MAGSAFEFELLPGMHSGDAWIKLRDAALKVFMAPYSRSTSKDVRDRERQIAPADLYLSGCAWDLWEHFDLPSTKSRLDKFWQDSGSGKAILILDALSLRELPFLIEALKNANLAAIEITATATPLPADTTPFAKALGFGQRSVLQDGSTNSKHLLPNAKTQAMGSPFADCLGQIKAEPNWIFWHHLMDDRLHDLSGPDGGLDRFVNEAKSLYLGEDFISFLRRLAQGRKLIITGDHGYAATGLFQDSEGDEALHLKDVFKSRRNAPHESSLPICHFLPPPEITLSTAAGPYRFASGRRKWKSQGGYPSLAHGGLSLLEVLVPYIEVAPVTP